MEAIALTYDQYVREVLVTRPWKEFALPTHGRVIEIGSGRGYGLTAIQSMGLDAVGLDIDPKGNGAIRGDARRLPFEPGSFDGAVCLRTLHHIPEHESVLTEVSRALRPGGFLLLAVGNSRSYTLLRLRTKLPGAIPNPNEHYYHLYGRDEIRSILESAGFRVANFRSCHYLPRLFTETGRWTRRSLSELARRDAALGNNPLIGRFGPLLLVHGVKR